MDLWRYEAWNAPTMYLEGSRPRYVSESLMFGCGILIQPLGLWVGAHYSRHNRRWCINLLPCLTFWVALPGGKAP